MAPLSGGLGYGHEMNCRSAREQNRPPSGPMIRIRARSIEEQIVFTLSCNGSRVLTTTKFKEALACLKTLDVNDPMLLLKAASQWGAVEIHGQVVVRIRRPLQ